MLDRSNPDKRYMIACSTFLLPFKRRKKIVPFLLLRYKYCSASSQLRYILTSMSWLLTHTVAHFIRPSFRPKTNNQTLKKFWSLSVSWVKVVENCKILTFKVNFYVKNYPNHYKQIFCWINTRSKSSDQKLPISDFQSQFLCQKLPESFPIFFLHWRVLI